jgi:hypothetical protein
VGVGIVDGAAVCAVGMVGAEGATTGGDAGRCHDGPERRGYNLLFRLFRLLFAFVFFFLLLTLGVGPRGNGPKSTVGTEALSWHVDPVPR